MIIFSSASINICSGKLSFADFRKKVSPTDNHLKESTTETQVMTPKLFINQNNKHATERKIFYFHSSY